MEEWKKKIVEKFTGHDKRKAEVKSTFNKLIDELLRENGIRSGEVDLVEEFPMSWKITINSKSIVVSDKIIDQYQTVRRKSDRGILSPIEEKIELDEALKKLLMEYFQ